MEQSTGTSMRVEHGSKPKISQRILGLLHRSGQKVKRVVKKLKPKANATGTKKKKPLPKFTKQLRNLKLMRRKVGDFVPRLRPETIDSPFANLPPELHLEIGHWLGNKDILRVSRTCRKLKVIYAGKALYYQMARTLLIVDLPFVPVKGPNQLDGQMTFDKFKNNLFRPDNKPQLCYFSNFLYRQSRTGTSTRRFLVLLLEHLVHKPILKDSLPTIKRISQTLGASINDHASTCVNIQGHLLHATKLNILNYLIKNGFLLTSATSPALEAQKPLHYCARRNNLESVIYLLSHGFDASEKDVDGMSPIFKALGLYPPPLDIPAKHEGLIFYIDRKIKIVKLLIAAGGDKDCTDAPESPVLRLFSRYDDCARGTEYLSLLVPAFIKVGLPGNRYPAYGSPGFSRPTSDPSSSTAESSSSTSPINPLSPPSSSSTADITSSDYLDTEINTLVTPLYKDKALNNPLDFLLSPPSQDRILPYLPRMTLLSTFLAAELSPDTRNAANLTPLQMGIFRLGAVNFDVGLESSAVGVAEEKRFLLAACKLLIKYGANKDEAVASLGGYNVVECAAALGEVEFCEALVGVEEAKVWCEVDMPGWIAVGWFEGRVWNGVKREVAREEIRSKVRKVRGFRSWEG